MSIWPKIRFSAVPLLAIGGGCTALLDNPTNLDGPVNAVLSAPTGRVLVIREATASYTVAQPDMVLEAGDRVVTLADAGATIVYQQQLESTNDGASASCEITLPSDAELLIVDVDASCQTVVNSITDGSITDDAATPPASPIEPTSPPSDNVLTTEQEYRDQPLRNPIDNGGET